MILQAAQVTIGVLLGLLIFAGWICAAMAAIRLGTSLGARLAHLRPVWWLRARLAARRLRRS